MADKKIGELPDASGFYVNTLLVGEQQGFAVKLTGEQIMDACGGSGGGGGYVPVPGPVGPQGPKGNPGEDGATFTPEVSEDGTLSWSNDKGLPNPDPVNIKGPPGEGGGGEGNPDAVTTNGGGEILMPVSLGTGPYEIEFTEEEDGGGGSGGSGGVTSFNERTGAVYAQYGDYTAAMVGAVPSSLITTKKWSGTLPNGSQVNIDFTNPFNMGFTFAPFVMFYLAVTAETGTLKVYAGETTTASFGGSGVGNSFSRYYMFFIGGNTPSYHQLGVPYNENEQWRGNLGLELTGGTGTYNVYALFMNAGEQ